MHGVGKGDDAAWVVGTEANALSSAVTTRVLRRAGSASSILSISILSMPPRPARVSELVHTARQNRIDSQVRPRHHGCRMKPRITLLTLGVDDLERSLVFYRDGLGLPTDGIIGTEFEHGAVAFF